MDNHNRWLRRQLLIARAKWWVMVFSWQILGTLRLFVPAWGFFVTVCALWYGFNELDVWAGAALSIAYAWLAKCGVERFSTWLTNRVVRDL